MIKVYIYELSKHVYLPIPATVANCNHHPSPPPSLGVNMTSSCNVAANIHVSGKWIRSFEIVVVCGYMLEYRWTTQSAPLLCTR